MDGTPAAMLHAHDGFLADEGCGYVRHVGVRRERRGQGLARLLLRTAFAADAARPGRHAAARRRQQHDAGARPLPVPRDASRPRRRRVAASRPLIRGPGRHRRRVRWVR
ncbi:MAG: GNAT family N-acetyltransferase [Acidimicrobiales bacterium]|nr:GNAT family N-acetyltransferase [Acidimicrobiales bacterium]